MLPASRVGVGVRGSVLLLGEFVVPFRTFATRIPRSIERASAAYCKTLKRIAYKFEEPPSDGRVWDIKAATCVRRRPYLMPEPDPFEQRMHAFTSVVRAMRSEALPDELWTSEFDRGKEEMGSQKRRIRSVEFVPGRDPPVTPYLKRGHTRTKAMQDVENIPPSGIVAVASPSYTAEHFLANLSHYDLTRRDRAARQSLFLLVRKKREDHAWQFPMMTFRDNKDESLQQCAERRMKEMFVKMMEISYLSNAPQAHWTFNYSPEERERRGVDGAKVFFFEALYVDGPVRLTRTSGVEEFAWVTRDELGWLVDDQAMWEYVCHSFPVD